jgi:hypothetical protein
MREIPMLERPASLTAPDQAEAHRFLQLNPYAWGPRCRVRTHLRRRQRRAEAGRPSERVSLRLGRPFLEPEAQ